MFAIRDSDLQLFCREAKKYGVLYCVLKDRDATDGLTDIMARAEDASKINRIIERFGLATVDMAQVKQEIEQSRAERQPDTSGSAHGSTWKPGSQPQEPMTEQEMDGFWTPCSPRPQRGGGRPYQSAPDRDVDKFLKAAMEASPAREEGRTENPPWAGQRNPVRPRLPQSPKRPTIRVSLIRWSVPAPSVRQALKEIRAEQKQRVEDRAKGGCRAAEAARHKLRPKEKNKKSGSRRSDNVCRTMMICLPASPSSRRNSPLTRRFGRRENRRSVRASTP